MFRRFGSYAEAALPSPEVLHGRAASHYEHVEIEPNNVRLMPRFNSAVELMTNVSDKQRIITDRQGQTVGVRFWDDVLTADGIDRGVTTYVPYAEYASDYPFAVLMDTAWFTGLEGHNDRIAERFMRELGVPVTVVGPEFSAAEPQAIDGERCLGRLALMCVSFSQMRSMEASAEIYATLLGERPQYGLQDVVIGVGESRGAMGEQIRRLQLAMRGITTLHSDITDPSAHRHALRSKKDLCAVAAWPLREAIGSMAVGAALLKNGELHREIATVPIDRRHIVGAILGTGPSLLNGEEGMFPAYTRLDHPQHIANFRGNGVAHSSERRESYANHIHTTIVDLKGPHLGLAYPSVQQRVINRTHMVGVFAMNGTTPDWQVVHGNGKHDALRQDVAA